MAPTTTEPATQPLSVEERLDRMEEAMVGALHHPALYGMGWRSMDPARKSALAAIEADVQARKGSDQ